MGRNLRRAGLIPLVAVLALALAAGLGLIRGSRGGRFEGGGEGSVAGEPIQGAPLFERDRPDREKQSPDESLLGAGRDYRSSGPHKVVIYEPAEASAVSGLRSVMTGPGYIVGFVDQEPPEEEGRIEVHDEMNIIRLLNAPFDTTKGEPPLPAHSMRDLPSTGRSLVLVQAPGPVNDSWLAEIRQTGTEPVAYLPENAYVALADAAAFERLRRLQEDLTIQFAGIYHPFYAIKDSLAGASGEQEIAFLVPRGGEGAEALSRIAIAAGKKPRQKEVGSTIVAIARIDAAVARDIVRESAVIGAEVFPRIELLDERTTQWMSGSRTADRSNAVLGSGYLNWYSSKGFGGDAGFAIEVSDSGLTQSGSITAGTVHPDLLGPSGELRVVAAKNYTSDPNMADSAGHGTAVAGIIAGRNTATGPSYEDADGFNYGVGVDPEARLVISKAFDSTGAFSLRYIFDGPRDAYRAGARISNGSWGSAQPTPEYDIMSFLFDAHTADVLPDEGRQEMAFVFAAGNSGPGSYTIESPGNAKNVIAAGSHENARSGWVDNCDQALGQFSTPNTLADDMDDLSGFSSRGPTLDGRTKPDIVAPGIHVTTHMVPTQEPCPGSGLPSGFSGYTSGTGTSFSAPHVSGQLGLLRRWFGLRGWKAPSPAMLKAYTVDGAVYLQGLYGGGDLPTNTQGFGAAALESLLTDTTMPLVDQSFVFTQTGQQYEASAAVADPAKPLTVTLAYTDSPGNTVGASYVNDLDLEVVVGGVLYRGNVTSGQYSVAGGSADPRNNVERVSLPAGQSGPVTVRVKAKNIAGDGVPGNVDLTDQDFALVVSNIADTNLLTVESFGFTDRGDGNGRLGSPEPFEIWAVVRNLGSATATSVTGSLSSSTAGVSLSRPGASFGNIPSGGTASNAAAFKGLYEGNCTTDIEFTLMLTSGAENFINRFTIPADPQPRGTAKPFEIPILDGQYMEAGLDVAGGGAVLDVSVYVGLTHLVLGDVVVTLRSPQGTEVVLSNRRGGTNRTMNAAFDDDLGHPISDANAFNTSGLVAGSFRPDQALSTFNGQSAQGTWVVRVYDQVVGGGGQQGTFMFAAIWVTTGCLQPACTSRPASPASTGYLAEGATAGGFDTWVLVANPGSSRVTACLTFLTESGAVPGPVIALPPLSRKSILADTWVTSYNVATVVEGIDGQVLAERAMYSSQPGLEGAHAVKASGQTSNQWFLPEGATSGPFETWVLVANPSATQSASVSVTYMTSTGPVAGPSFGLSPQARHSVRVDDTVDTYHVSTFVSSTGAAVVAERATYVDPGERRGATASPGVTSAFTKWYLAEGATAGGFETWILVANPSDTQQAQATVRLITENGPAAAIPLSLAPRSRQSIRADDFTDSFHVSTIVESTGTGVVAERAMYFDHPILGKGAASGEAILTAGSEWMAVEGATAGNFETWVLVANPGATTTVTVRVDFLSTGGVAASTVLDVPAQSRRSIRADDYIDSYDVTTRVVVQGGGQVIVERSTYTTEGPSSDATAGPAFRTA